MKVLLMTVLCVALTTDPGKIAKINQYKIAAKKAYLEGDFKTAIEKYQYLIDSLDVNEEEVRMNLANAYFQANDTTQALRHFQDLSQSGNKRIKSKAEQQLGVLTNRQGKFEEALNHFKEAIKADPTNNDARYNYELLKRKLEEEKKKDQQNKQNQDQNKQDQQQQNQDKQKQDQEKKDQQKQDDKKEQEKKDQQNQDQKNDQQKKDDQQKKEQQQQEEQEQKEKDEKDKKDVPPSVTQKLKEMNMSEEKAKMILEAMKNQEIQYLQQNKRKATKPKDKGKPDW
jgi:Ca-activated chloride channel homolog